MERAVRVAKREVYAPKETFLRTLSEGSLCFECSLSLYVIVNVFGFTLGTRASGGCWVWLLAKWHILAYGVRIAH